MQEGTEQTPKFASICGCFARSMGWIIILVAWAIFFDQLSNITFVDFVHVNPNRSRQNAASIPFLFTPVFVVIVAIALGLSCAGSMITQALLTNRQLHRHGSKGLYQVFAAVPIMALVTWYSYDYLTPSNIGFGFNEPADWTPYQHGLTLPRYVGTLVVQFAITAFCLLRLKFLIEKQARSGRKLLIALFLTCLVVGTCGGIWSGIRDTSGVTKQTVEGQPPSTTFHLDPVHEWKSDQFRGHAQWSADGSLLLSQSSVGGPLAILDRNGQLQTTKTLPESFTHHFILDPDHVLLMGSVNTSILFYVVDLTSGKTVFEQQQPDAMQSKLQLTVRFAISQDGTKLAVVYHGAIPGVSIHLYDTKDWTKLADVRLPEATSNVSVMAFSPFGNRLAVQTGPAVFLIDPRTGAILQTIPVSAEWLAISHDEQKIAVEEEGVVFGQAHSKSVKIFQLSNGTQIAEYPLEIPGTHCEHDDNCEAISPPIWSADDQSVIFAGRMQTLHVWKPFDPNSHNRAMSSPLISNDLALSPDGQTLAISTGYMVSFYDATKL